MEIQGVPRKVDHLGRVVVPVEFRRALGLREGDEVAVALEGNRLVLAKVTPACTFCGAATELRPFKGRHVCQACAAELRSP